MFNDVNLDAKESDEEAFNVRAIESNAFQAEQ